LQIIARKWRMDGAFVRYLRHSIWSPPTRLVDQGSREGAWPQWDELKAELARTHRAPGTDYPERAVNLERDAWEMARDLLGENADCIDQTVTHFWEELFWNKLLAGFPYFAFRSSFKSWWQVCVSRLRLPGKNPPVTSVVKDVESHDDEETHRDEFPSQDQLFTMLRCYRETYRLVRLTFFPRSPANPEADNERYRKSVDVLWRNWLERKLLESEQSSPGPDYRAMAEELGLSRSAVYVIGHKLGQRIVAGMRARLEHLARPARRTSAADGAQACGRDGPGPDLVVIRTVEVLCRLALPQESLLGPFTAFLWLYPRFVLPNRPDPWSFRRFLGELWWWVSDDGFDEALANAGQNGRRSARALLRASGPEEPLGELVGALRQAESEEGLAERLDPDLVEHGKQKARQLLFELTGRDGFDSWAKVMGDARLRISTHWIVPVVYLSAVEQRHETELLAELRADGDNDAADLIDLARTLVRLEGRS
jgi:hypothetical protein